MGPSWKVRETALTGCLEEKLNLEFQSMPAAFTASESEQLAAEAIRYKNEGYKAMKLRFGWARLMARRVCNGMLHWLALCEKQ